MNKHQPEVSEGRVSNQSKSGRKREAFHKRAEEALQQSHERFRALAEATFEGIAFTEAGRILEVNDQLVRMLGYGKDELIGAEVSSVIFPEDQLRVLENIQKGRESTIEHRFVRKDGLVITVEAHGKPFTYEGRGIRVTALRDITERKKAERRQHLSAEILRVLNEPLGLPDVISRILTAIKRETGFDAVGIRLRDGDDFPYFAHSGFSHDFLLTENTVLARDKNGGLCRDENGKISLECTCGLILAGQTDPANPLFTEGGSFWTNNSLLLLDLPANQDPRLHPRNKCIHQGYCSVALVPIRANRDIVGLLQLNDRKKNYFTLETIHFFEGISASIGVALMRKQQEDALRESEARHRLLFDSSRDAMIIAAPPSWRFTSGNPAAAEMFRAKDAAEFTALGPWDISPERQPDGSPSADKARQMNETALREGFHFFEWTHRRLDGEDFLATVLLTRIETAGQPFIQGTVRDITAQKQAEERLREYEKVVESSRDMIVVVDRSYCYILANDAFLSYRRLRREDVVGRSAAEVLGADVFESRVKKHLDACFEGETVEYEMKYGYPELGERDLFVSYFPIQGSCGVTGVASIIQDITERKLAEEALRKAHDELEHRVQERTAELRQAYETLQAETAQRERVEQQLLQAQKMEAVGTLSGGIAHDFNNILAAIIGFTEMVVDDVSDNVDVRHKMEQVLKAGFRGRDLVKQILTFSRRSDREKKELHLSPLLQETLKLLRASIPTTIGMKLHLDESRDSVYGDTSQVQQIVMNLCANASHAMRETGGTLGVSLRAITLDSRELLPEPDMSPGDYLILSVTDTGHGMDDTVLKRIFEPFFTTKERGQGTGLGLSVVYGIVKSHQGGIRVSSRPGKGSVFRVYLPAASPAAKVEDETASWETLPTGKERVLFVDDEEAIIELGQGVLTRLGYRVVTKRSGREALKTFRDDGTFDLVITDQTMPGMTGVMLAAELLKLKPDLPVILCTGYSESVSRETAQKVGIREFLMKPLSNRDLAGAARKALEKNT